MQARPAAVCCRLLWITLIVAKDLSPPSQQYGQRFVECRVLIFQFVQRDDGELAHVTEGGELVEVAADGLLLPQELVQPVDHNDPISEAGAGDVIGQRQLRPACQLVNCGEILLADADAELFGFGNCFHSINPFVFA